MYKQLILFSLLSTSFHAFAEHEATYCGKLVSGGNQFVARLQVDFEKIAGDIWENQYKPRSEYAGILHVENGSLVQRRIQSFLTNSKENTVFCVHARWSGVLDDGSLETDKVYRIDYQSRFKTLN